MVLPLCTVRKKASPVKCFLSYVSHLWTFVVKENGTTSHSIRASQIRLFKGNLLIDVFLLLPVIVSLFFPIVLRYFFLSSSPYISHPFLPQGLLTPECDKCRLSSLRGSAPRGQEAVVWHSNNNIFLNQFTFRLIPSWVCGIYISDIRQQPSLRQML